VKVDSALVVMAKQPVPGRTKTRLCPPFTAEKAAHLAEALLRDTLQLAAAIEALQLAVAITPPQSEYYFRQIAPPGALLLPVEGANIGICLDKALSALLDLGFEKAIALNADGPSLPPDYLCQAFRSLDSHDLVLGPGEDGGYYLIGLKRKCSELFEGIPWSTHKVLAATLAQTEKVGWTVALTPPWYDIDLPDDVQRLRQELDLIADERLTYTRRFFAAGDEA